jgi:parallel beta-helix repeat protein
LNTYFGNGAGLTASSTTPSNNFGVGLVGGSKDNTIERNKIGGNSNGVFIDSSGDSGNVIRRNLIAGNPSSQVAIEFAFPVGADIRDLSTPGANTFDDNRCLTYLGGGPSPCPNLGNPGDDEADREQRDLATFGRSRLAFPEARLINAVFRQGNRGLPSAAKPPHTPDSGSLTVTGRVVDAACYMLHAPAATSASHMECGAACLARGVPLAIATDDGTLYFPADGNARLKSLLNAHVRASGTVVDRHEPMELTMPVGKKNQMVVRVEGGYKQITIESLEKISSKRRASPSGR